MQTTKKTIESVLEADSQASALAADVVVQLRAWSELMAAFEIPQNHRWIPDRVRTVVNSARRSVGEDPIAWGCAPREEVPGAVLEWLTSAAKSLRSDPEPVRVAVADYLDKKLRRLRGDSRV